MILNTNAKLLVAGLVCDTTNLLTKRVKIGTDILTN